MDAFTYKGFYTGRGLHTETVLRREMISQRDASIYLQVLLHRDTFNTEMLLHTGALRYKYFYTEVIFLRETLDTGGFSHRYLYTFTQRCFTQVFLHVNTSAAHFTHTFFYADIPLHANTFTKRHFDTQWQASLDANTLTRWCSFCAHFLYIHACSVTGMPLITHAFTQKF